MNIIFLDLDDNELNSLNIGNIMQGHSSQAFHFKIKNNGTEDLTGITLTSSVLAEGLGLPIDTINSTFISLDNIDYWNELSLDLIVDAEQDVYIKYQPSTIGRLGSCYWALLSNINNNAISPFPEWNYKTSFKVRSNNSDTDYQVKITIPYLEGLMQTSFNDIRFALTDGTILSHVKLFYDTVSAQFLIKIPSILALPDDIQVMVYSGNDSASDVSDPVNTFDWFDTFDNLDNWSIVNGTPTLNDSKVTLPAQTEIKTNIGTINRPVTIYSYSKITGIVTNEYPISNLAMAENANKQFMTGFLTKNNYCYLYSYDGTENVVQLPDSFADNQYHLFEMAIDAEQTAKCYIDSSLIWNIEGHITYDIDTLWLINDAAGDSGQSLEVDWLAMSKYSYDPPIVTNLQEWDLNTVNIKLNSTIIKDSIAFEELTEYNMPKLTMQIGDDVFD